MPYISQEKRAYLHRDLARLCERVRMMDVGTLNYVITSIILDWLPEDARYEDYNAAVGVLACAQAELYREQVAKYENVAKVINGPL